MGTLVIPTGLPAGPRPGPGPEPTVEAQLFLEAQAAETLGAGRRRDTGGLGEAAGACMHEHLTCLDRHPSRTHRITRDFFSLEGMHIAVRRQGSARGVLRVWVLPVLATRIRVA